MHSTNDHRTSIGSADTLQYRLLPWIYTSYISYHSSKIQYLASALAEYTQVKHSGYASSKGRTQPVQYTRRFIPKQAG